jgi:hypothetical protein
MPDFARERDSLFAATAASDTMDDAFLSFEGTGQLAGYRWLFDPQGGGLAPEIALHGTRRGGKFWSQDEGPALYLVLDRLADWPTWAYAATAEGAPA